MIAWEETKCSCNGCDVTAWFKFVEATDEAVDEDIIEATEEAEPVDPDTPLNRRPEKNVLLCVNDVFNKRSPRWGYWSGFV